MCGLVKDEVIDMVQLHGSEDNAYIAKLREMAEVPIIQAFKIIDSYDAESACFPMLTLFFWIREWARADFRLVAY